MDLRSRDPIWQFPARFPSRDPVWHLDAHCYGPLVHTVRAALAYSRLAASKTCIAMSSTVHLQQDLILHVEPEFHGMSQAV